MSLWRSWKEYYKLTKGKPPRKLLVRALPFVQERGLALDLGAGALSDSKYLLDEGFERVLAEDQEPLAQEVADAFPKERFTYEATRMEEFDFPTNTFDLVNAQYSLPFLQREDFENVWRSIEGSLKTGGIFTGQLFGDRDEWVGREHMTFHTKQKAEELFKNFEVLVLEEEEEDKPTYANIMKHWHVFQFIVRVK